MDSWQKQRRNTDFLLKCMMIKRGSGLSQEDLSRISDMIDKEEKHLVDNYKIGLRGSFHKQILHNLYQDKRVINYIEKIEETDCRASLYLQLGVLEALRDYFELRDVSDICSVCGKERTDCLDRTHEESDVKVATGEGGENE